MTADQHDPGGKVRLALMEGVKGDAVVSDDGRYRHLMRRWLGETFPDRYILFIGMNPSTADATVNDPTCAREWTFAQREGFDAMVKANVGDYRATHPKMLLESGVEASSPVNLATIRQAAAGAARVVLCHGKLNRALVRFLHPVIINADLTDGNHFGMARQLFYFLKCVFGEFLQISWMKPNRRIHAGI